jgi:multidrug efflux pump subunit AcrA (membrane-fusion protein)
MTQTTPRHNPHLSLVLRSQAKLLSARSLQEAATALANELATAFSLRAACVGVVTDGSARLIATAHLAAPDKRDLNDPLVTAAMDEAIDQAAVVVFPEQNAAGLNVTRAHQMLARRSGTALCTVPILAETSPIGALLLEHEPDAVFSAEMLEAVEQIAALAGPVIELRQRAEAPVLQRVGNALRPPGKAPAPRTRLLGLAAAVLVLAALLVPLPHTLTADARIEGEIQRAMVAPVDGFIEKAFVRPGDVVEQGQTLVRLADRELQLERRKLESELAQHDNAFAAAQSEADRGKMVLAHARGEESGARIALIDHQLERSLIRAPMDSVVLTGNLDQAEGTPVQRGDVLLVLAPQARYRLMIEVDERDIARVAAGAAGQVALSALPDTAMRFTVQRVMPVTTDRDGRHFVEVEAQLDAPAAATQPGMRGYARIESGTSPLLSQLTRRLRGWFEIQIWAWLGL